MVHKRMVGHVYLLCFDERYPNGPRPRHYLGWAVDPNERAAQHEVDSDVRLLQALREKGIGFKMVRTWPNKTRNDERAMKKNRNLARLCPNCRAEFLAHRNEIARAAYNNRKHETNGGSDGKTQAKDTVNSGPNHGPLPHRQE